MSRTDTSSLRSAEAIAAARAEGRAALIGYLPVGYPDLAGSIDAARTLIDHGADMIELGLPYSDPVMDGPVIQRAAGTALARGNRTRHVMEATAALAGRGAAILVKIGRASCRGREAAEGGERARA